jgi:hypothetical protein
MTIPQFDIFMGAPDRNAMWMESAKSLEIARIRIRDLAAQNPGSYFVFSSTYHKVLDVVDSCRKNDEAKERTIRP